MRYSQYQNLFYRYGIAAFAVEVAILIRWLANPWLGDQYPPVLIFGALECSGSRKRSRRASITT